MRLNKVINAIEELVSNNLVNYFFRSCQTNWDRNVTARKQPWDKSGTALGHGVDRAQNRYHVRDRDRDSVRKVNDARKCISISFSYIFEIFGFKSTSESNKVFRVIFLSLHP